MFEDGGNAARVADDAQLVFAVLKHVLLLSGAHFAAAGVGVRALEHQHALAASVPVLRKTRAGLQAQQASALLLARRTQVDGEGLDAAKWGERPMAWISGAGQFGDELLLRDLPEGGEAPQEGCVPERQLRHRVPQSLGAASGGRSGIRQQIAQLQQALLEVLTLAGAGFGEEIGRGVSRGGRFERFHGPGLKYEAGSATDRSVTAGPDYLTPPSELEAVLAQMGPADLVLLASHALRVGNLEYAAAICEVWRGPPEPSLELTRAAALFGLGQREPAIALVNGVLERAPAHLGALFFRAQMAQHGGDTGTACALLLQVLEVFPDFPGAQAALAGARFPGPPYREVLRRMHELVRPRTYLEIGVETGATLALAQAAERAVGIDPDASKLRRELLPPCARVFHETSDSFFEQRSRTQTLGAHRVDLAFIDGMHWFEYALRDFINVEAWSAPHTSVVFHDCLPVFPLAASRERRSRFWVGDVWKVVPILRRYRPELRVKIIATAPSGLCVVRGLDPSSRVLRANLDAIIDSYRALDYPARALEVPDGFELVPADEAGLREALQ